MREGQAKPNSRTGCAAPRISFTNDAPLVFADPLVVRVLPTDALAELREREAMERTHPFARGMRAFLCARSRFAEDALERAAAKCVRQYLVLAAGLDTFGTRAGLPECSAGLQELLMECGFMRVEDLDGESVNKRYFVSRLEG
jgi:O-methyltransferase involved in polyketide biosynthesis